MAEPINLEEIKKKVLATTPQPSPVEKGTSTPVFKPKKSAPIDLNSIKEKVLNQPSAQKVAEKPDELKAIGIKPATITQAAVAAFDGVAQNLKEASPTIGDVLVKKFTDSVLAPIGNPYTVNALMLKDARLPTGEEMKYVSKSLLAGASQGVYSNPMETENMNLKVAGWTAHVLGNILTGGIIFKSLKAIGLLGTLPGKVIAATKKANEAKRFLLAEKAFQAIGESTPEALQKAKAAYKTARNAKIGATALQSAAEGGWLGGLVGGTKGVIRGDSFQDIIVGTLADSLQFAGFGAALSPLMHGAEVIKGRKITGKIQQGFEQAIQKENVLSIIKKVNELKPYLSLTEILANPQELKNVTSESLKTLAEGLFKGPSAPAGVIYETNQNLKDLFDKGNYSEAIDTLTKSILQDVKKNNELKQFLMSPFINDAESIAKAKAATFSARQTKYASIPNFEKVLTEYHMHPTAADLITGQKNVIKNQMLEKVGSIGASQSAKTAYKSAFSSKLKQYETNNVKLEAVDIENIVYTNIQKMLDKLSPTGQLATEQLLGKSGKIGFSAKDVGVLKDAEEAITSLVTLNAPLGRSIFQALQKGFFHEDNISKVEDPAHLTIFQKLKNKRIHEIDLAEKTNKLMGVTQAIKITKDPVALAKLKEDRVALLSSLRSVSSTIRDITNSIQGGLEPEVLQKLQQQVNEIYLPSRGAIASGSVAEASKNDLQRRILSNDNPYYLKADGDLANQLHGLSMGKYDLKGLNKISIENVQRKLAKELGVFNPIQQAVIDPMKKRAVQMQSELETLYKKINSWGIKEGSDLSAKIQDLGEGKISQASDEWLALSPKDQKAALAAKAELRGIYDTLIDRVNLTLKNNNFEQVKKITGVEYFHHQQKNMELLGEKMARILEGTYNAEEFKMYAEKVFAENRRVPFFSAGLKRTGKETISDAIGGLKEYARQALHVIHMTDLVRQVDSIAHFAPEGLGEFLANIKNTYLLNRANQFDKHWYDPINKVLNFTRRATSKAMLLGSASVMIKQLFSGPLNFGISGKAGIKALLQMGQKDINRIVSQSTNLASRNALTEGQAFSESIFKGAAKEIKPLFNLLGKKALPEKVFNKAEGVINWTGKKAGQLFDLTGTVSEKWEKIAAFGLQKFDGIVAKHAFLTGYNKAIAMGLDEAAAIKFGDYWVGVVQGDMSKIGQPEFLQTTIGRAFGQYQSFTINLFSSLWNDLPLYAQSEGSSKAISVLLKTYAAGVLTNEVLKASGVPPSYDMYTIVPFLSTAKYGLPGFPGMAADYLKSKLASGYIAEKAKSEFETALPSLLGIPGTAQLIKSYKYLTSKKTKNDTPFQKAVGIAFGMSGYYTRKDRDLEKKLDKKSPFKKKIKKTIFGN